MEIFRSTEVFGFDAVEIKVFEDEVWVVASGIFVCTNCGIDDCNIFGVLVGVKLRMLGD